MRQKKCRGCGAKFHPTKPLQTVCTWVCAVKVGRENAAKVKRNETREAKIKAKSRAQWLKEAQQAFNAWIRHRDTGKPCISCGRAITGQTHAGHYRSVGAAPELRFDESNIHSQCVSCNLHKSGNAIEYRIGLIARIGIEKVEWLEAKHEPRHYTIADAQEIKATYRKKLKEST